MVKLAWTAHSTRPNSTPTGKREFGFSTSPATRTPASALYAAIWNKAGGTEPVERHDLTGAQYQQAFDDFAKQGLRLKEVSGYSPGGADHYAAIWEKGGDGAPWIAHNGDPLSDYQTQFDVDRFQGWQPLYVQAFTSGGTAQFDTIWESPFSGADLNALQSSCRKRRSAPGSPASRSRSPATANSFTRPEWA